MVIYNVVLIVSCCDLYYIVLCTIRIYIIVFVAYDLSLSDTIGYCTFSFD